MQSQSRWITGPVYSERSRDGTVVFEQLRSEVAAFADTLEELVEHRTWLGDQTTDEIRNTVDAVRQRLARKEPSVAVVGEKKAGKSTFLNAVLGARVLGTAVRECTGTVTFIRRANRPHYRATFRDGTTEEFDDHEGRELLRMTNEVRKLERWLGDRIGISCHNNDREIGKLVGKAGQDTSKIIANHAEAERESRAASDKLAAAKVREQQCIAALPFFLRPVPKWMMPLIAVLRVLLGWVFRKQKMLADDATLQRLRLQIDQLERKRLARYIAEIHDLTDMNKRGGAVVELTIDFPATHLPDGITMIDTPGVNTENQENQDRAWNAIRDNADGCIIVSGLNQVMSGSTRKFLQEVREFIPHILLVLTKFDQVLEDAEDDDDDAETQAEEARSKGVKLFAKEVGRAADEVFAVAVASEAALKGDNFGKYRLAERFASETAKLFDQLRKERSLVLAARSAVAIRSFVRRIDEAQTRAERMYREHIESLEAQRVPNPGLFVEEKFQQALPLLDAWAAQIINGACDYVPNAVNEITNVWTQRIYAFDDKESLKAASATFNEELKQQVDTLMDTLKNAMGEWSVQALDQVKEPFVQELRERYYIVQHLRESSAAKQFAQSVSGGVFSLNTDIDIGVEGTIDSFETGQLLLAGGGMAAGIFIGSLVFPGVGTLIGGAIGALAGFFKTLDSLKNDCVNSVNTKLQQTSVSLVNQIQGKREAVLQSLSQQLRVVMGDAIAQFQDWIDSVIREEEERIQQQRRHLDNLLKTRDTLKRHDKELQRLQKEATVQSRGLCA